MQSQFHTWLKISWGTSPQLPKGTCFWIMLPTIYCLHPTYLTQITLCIGLSHWPPQTILAPSVPTTAISNPFVLGSMCASDLGIPFCQSLNDPLNKQYCCRLFSPTLWIKAKTGCALLTTASYNSRQSHYSSYPLQNKILTLHTRAQWNLGAIRATP